jgi:hypothetical protein
MRGTVYQREDSWIVSCKKIDGSIVEYPIHPDDVWMLHDENVDVDFILKYVLLETDPSESVPHASIKILSIQKTKAL